MDLTNKVVKLSEADKNNENLPYPQISTIRFNLINTSGKLTPSTITRNFFINMNALFILFDLTNPESFKSIENNINITKKFFEICKKNTADTKEEFIKQRDLFKDIPIAIIGNKSDLNEERKIKNEEIEEKIKAIRTQNDFTCFNYYEISVKNNIGIEKIFQDTVFYYFKRNFESIVYKKKNSKGTLSNVSSEKDLINISKDKSDDDSQKELFLDIKEDKKEKRKRQSMDKSFVIFHQLIDKVKKQFYYEINSLKEENKKEIDKLKNEISEEKKALNEKMNLLEQKNKELEEQIQLKNNEIELLKQKIEKENAPNTDVNTNTTSTA
jgi:hypothetical protein